jgi:hypothetical protein
MTSKTITKKLADLGFAYDEDVTCKTFYWAGTIDPIGSTSIGGECRGVVVSGNTRAEMDAEALEQAALLAPMLEPCTDPECDMHGNQ